MLALHWLGRARLVALKITRTGERACPRDVLPASRVLLWKLVHDLLALRVPSSAPPTPIGTESALKALAAPRKSPPQKCRIFTPPHTRSASGAGRHRGAAARCAIKGDRAGTRRSGMRSC